MPSLRWESEEGRIYFSTLSLSSPQYEFMSTPQRWTESWASRQARSVLLRRDEVSENIDLTPLTHSQPLTPSRQLLSFASGNLLKNRAGFLSHTLALKLKFKSEKKYSNNNYSQILFIHSVAVPFRTIKSHRRKHASSPFLARCANNEYATRARGESLQTHKIKILQLKIQPLSLRFYIFTHSTSRNFSNPLLINFQFFQFSSHTL